MLVEPTATPDPSVIDAAIGPPPHVAVSPPPPAAVKVNFPPGNPAVLALPTFLTRRAPDRAATDRGFVTATATEEPPTVVTTPLDGLYVAVPHEAFAPGAGVPVSTTVQLVAAARPEIGVEPTVTPAPSPQAVSIGIPSRAAG